MDQKISPLKARREFNDRLKRGLVSSPVLFACEHCRQQVSSAMEWTCGYCGHENRRTALYSFLCKCQKCDREPKALVCPLCEKVIPLTEDRDTTTPAFKTKKLPPVAPVEDPQMKKRNEHTALLEDKQRELEVVEYDAKIARAKLAAPITNDETIEGKIERQLNEALAEGLTAYDAATRALKRLDVECKDDPKRKEMAEIIIRHFLEDRSLDGGSLEIGQ